MENIKYCNSNNYKNLKFFLTNNWRNISAILTNKKLFDWYYLNKKNKKYNFLTLNLKKEIKSCIGIIINKNKFKNIFWLTFWLSPFKGIFGFKILVYLIKNFKNCIIASNGISLKTVPFYKLLGFKIVNLNHYYIINNNLRKYNLIKSKRIKLKKIKKNKTNIVISSNLKFYKSNNLKKYENFFFKDYNYFKNKYFFHPIYNYQFYLVYEKAFLLGFFVGRVSKFKGSKALRFVEYFGDLNVLKKIKYTLNKLLKNSKYEYIDFYNYGINSKNIKNSGFKKNNYKNIIIPNYFEPFQKKNIKIKSVFYPYNSKLIIFKGDGDQDRPSII